MSAHTRTQSSLSRRCALPAEPPRLPIVLDTREPYQPLPGSPLVTDFGGIVREALDTGDIALGNGLQHLCRIEAKWSLDDLVTCCTSERDRFSKCVRRLVGFPHRLMVVGGSMGQIETGQYFSKASPESILGSLAAWQSDGLPIALCGSRANAEREAARFLHVVIRRRWRELRSMVGAGQT
jgi:hypothetical protein